MAEADDDAVLTALMGAATESAFLPHCRQFLSTALRRRKRLLDERGAGNDGPQVVSRHLPFYQPETAAGEADAALAMAAETALLARDESRAV